MIRLNAADDPTDDAPSSRPSPESFERPDAQRQFPLHFEDKVLYVSRETLALHSPVFAQIFYNDGFVDGQGQSLTMTGKASAEFAELLRCITPLPLKSSVDQSNFNFLLKLADEYDIAQIRFDVSHRHQCSVYINEKVSKLEPNDCDAFFYADACFTYQLKEPTSRLIALIASLERGVIRENRNRLPMAVLMSVYEAKLSRTVAENLRHPINSQWSQNATCINCRLVTVTDTCSNCGQICPQCRNGLCVGFHSEGCQFRGKNFIEKTSLRCLCGYDFDAQFLWASW